MRAVMRRTSVQVLKKTPLYRPLRMLAVRRSQRAAFAEWERRGKPIPPPHAIKQMVLQEYAKKYCLRLLIETGTSLGDMVESMRHYFDRIYSIELSNDLHHKAQERFTGIDNIQIILGDSGTELEKLVKMIDRPALFWLDGHYSGGDTARGKKDTPVLDEIGHILNSSDRGHVIIIDDARCFGTDPAYPSIEELSEVIRSRRSDLDIAVQGDSIRITPK